MQEGKKIGIICANIAHTHMYASTDPNQFDEEMLYFSGNNERVLPGH